MNKQTSTDVVLRRGMVLQRNVKWFRGQAWPAASSGARAARADAWLCCHICAAPRAIVRSMRGAKKSVHRAPIKSTLPEMYQSLVEKNDGTKQNYKKRQDKHKNKRTRSMTWKIYAYNTEQKADRHRIPLLHKTSNCTKAATIIRRFKFLCGCTILQTRERMYVTFMIATKKHFIFCPPWRVIYNTNTGHNTSGTGR